MALADYTYERFLRESEGDLLRPVWQAAIQQWLNDGTIVGDIETTVAPRRELDSRVAFSTDGTSDAQWLHVPSYVARIALEIRDNLIY